MKSLLMLVALAVVLLLPALKNEGTTPTERDGGVTAVVLEKGDWRLDAAEVCLKQMLTSDWDYGRTDLRGILRATGFSLSKVTVRKVLQDPARIRFGYEFVNPEAVKTLYWEADCRVEDPEPSAEEKLASR